MMKYFSMFDIKYFHDELLVPLCGRVGEAWDPGLDSQGGSLNDNYLSSLYCLVITKRL